MLTKEQIGVKITEISGAKQSLRADIQSVLISIAGHVYDHRDVTMYNNLYNATRGMDRTAIARWIKTYGFGSLQADTGTYKLAKKAVDEGHFADGADVVDFLTHGYPNTEVAPAEDWWAMVSRTSAPKDIIVDKAIDSQVKAWTKAYEGTEKDVIVNMDACIASLAAAQKFIARVQANNDIAEARAAAEAAQALNDKPLAPISDKVKDMVVDTRNEEAPTMHMVPQVAYGAQYEAA